MTATQVSSAVTESMSLAAVRNFVRAAVSCITFSRGLCDDDSFFPYKFAGVPMQQLCGKSPEGAQLISWLNDGAFDALNQKYLKEMALCILSADGTEMLESYCFSLTYAADGADRAALRLVGVRGGNETQSTQASTALVSSAAAPLNDSGVAAGALLSTTPAVARDKRTKDQIVGDMCRLFTDLVEQISHLPPLLHERVVTMRLVYNERAPPQYQPPSFQPASVNMQTLYRREMRSELQVGCVDAKHLSVCAAIRHPLYQLVKHAARESQRSESTNATAEAAAASVATPPSTSASEATVLAGTRSRGAAAAAKAGAALAHTAHRPQSHSSDKAAAAATRPSFTISAAQLNGLRTVATLLASPKALRPAEVCFLVFTAFILTQAPVLRGGHAELRRTDVERYLRHECMFHDVPLETFLAVVTKLVRQGLMTRCATRADEWLVCDPPALLVSQLRRHSQVSVYLHPSEAEQLDTLQQRLDNAVTGHQGGTRARQKRRREATVPN